MKRLILAVCTVCVVAGATLYLVGAKTTPIGNEQSASQPSATGPTDESQPAGPSPTRQNHPAAINYALDNNRRASTSPGDARAVVGADNTLDSTLLYRAVDILVSPQTSHAQRQAVWKQLRESGKLDSAITELERRTASDLRSAEYPTALAQAYLQKCSVIQDVREQGVLALQADKLFDNALNLDPANWEARFTKAVALSYWPETMHKSEEVIQHFQTLIQEQEAQASQPQFAETYVWLGDQYQKAGQNEQARTIWSRGAALFPNNDNLNKKLTTAQ